MNLKNVGSVALSLVAVACIALGVGYNASTLGSDGAKVDAAQEPPSTPPQEVAQEETAAPVQQDACLIANDLSNEQLTEKGNTGSFWQAFGRKALVWVQDFLVAKILDLFWEIIIGVLILLFTPKYCWPWIRYKLVARGRKTFQNALKSSYLKIHWFTEPKKRNNYLWDGKIAVYSKESLTRKKENVLGYVAFKIQTFKRKKLPEQPTISVSRADLKAYQAAGGGVLFYVCVTPKETRVYYATLYPVKICELLVSNVEQEPYSLAFAPLPKNGLEQLAIITNIYQNVSLQASFYSNASAFDFRQFIENFDANDVESIFALNPKIIGAPYASPTSFLPPAQKKDGQFQNSITLSSEDIVKDEIPDSISFYVPDAHIETFLQEETQIYAKLKNGFTTPPLKPDCAKREFPNSTLLIDGQVFNVAVTFIRKKDVIKTKIGDCLEFEDGPECYTFFRCNDKRLSHFIEDLKLCLALANASSIMLCCDNQAQITIPITIIAELQDFLADKIEQYQKILKKLTRYAQLFEILRLDCNIDITTLTATDEIICNLLAETLIEKNPVELPKIIKPKCQFHWFPIRNQYVCLYIRPVRASKGYQLYDVLQNGNFTILNCKSRAKMLNEVLATLSVDALKSVANLNLPELCSMLKSLVESPNFEEINDLMLRCIAAFDECENPQSPRAVDLLQTAEALIAWLYQIAQDQSMDNYTFTRINQLQIFKRYRQFSNDEINYLKTLLQESADNIEIKFAANVLLDQLINAEVYWAEIQRNKKLRKIYQELPISTLYRRKQSQPPQLLHP